jgi:hypothetical protein
VGERRSDEGGLPSRARALKLIAVRRLVTTAVLAGLLVLSGAPALGAALPSSGTGIKGVVLDATCPGPCQYPPNPRPYTGPGLTVTVRSLATNKLVAILHPKDGRFRVEVRPGPYRVRARIAEERPPTCWQGEAKDVKVTQGAFTMVRLHVHNACVL